MLRDLPVSPGTEGDPRRAVVRMIVAALGLAAPLAAIAPALAQTAQCPKPLPAFSWVTQVTNNGESTVCANVTDTSGHTDPGGPGGPATQVVSTPQTGATAGGILVQSAGGTAGDIMAGNSYDPVIDWGKRDWKASSGNGGAGGNVSVSLASSLVASGAPQTYGSGSTLYNYGIVAQSLGGAGGTVTIIGGWDSQDFLGTVGTGGAAGNVGVAMGGSLTVGNASAATGTVVGVLAQSLGGGGGVANVFDHDQSNDFSKVYAGGNGGNVVVTVSPGATLALQGGNVQQGIIAQSVGAGAATTPDLRVKSTGSVGDGGQVSVANYASITGTGTSGFGILAQSIGGGGGVVTLDPESTTYAVANAQGAGSNVVVLHAGGATLATTGDDAAAIVAQALGDGGGILSTCDPATGTCAAGTVNSAQITIGSEDNKGYNAGTVNVSLGCNAAQSQATGGLFANCTPGGGRISTQGDASIGILAQSVASGGGNGIGNGLFRHVGSDGKSGGNGADVNVTVTGASQIATQGDGAFGILAQSVGGGGGNGGTARAWAAAVGGTGGMGGSGGNVSVTLGGAGDTATSIQTQGDFASGVVAQSIGGGGGNGGYAQSISFFVDVAIGGKGGNAGIGGAVGVTNYGAIATGGAQSAGILAQSVGGGGGVGGAALAYSTNNLFALSLAIGGDAGTGALAEPVTVNHAAGSITTAGPDAIGIIAQSIGGGGGSGGSAFAKAKVYSLIPSEVVRDPITFAMALGGTGGGGGDGDRATVTIGAGASVTTAGDGSVGVLAQSVGGGGGNGGDSSITSSIGTPLLGGPTNPQEFIEAYISDSFGYGATGSGGKGGDGATVSVAMDAAAGNISTTGNGASGIVAQSIGGGGGNGSAGNTAQDAKIQWKIITIPWKMGGTAGGTGGEVDVTYAGTIKTTGSNARGIVAQSIGGGGGLLAGGALASDGGSNSKVTQSITLGSDSTRSAAGAVTVAPGAASASIATSGGYSDGILAQSIGGGGGAAGNADNGVQVSGDLVLGYTAPTTPAGSELPSNFVMSLALGGQAGGDGGTVTVGNVNGSGPALSIQTAGAWSQGILAQSIGGGGGSAGAAALSGETGTYQQSIIFGGAGGGNGADVTVQGVGSIATQGFGSAAIVAQSIGGGGGFAVDGTGPTISRSFEVNTYDQARGGGISGTTTVALGTGKITTIGDLGYGVLAQSISVGGGVFGFGDGNSSGITPTLKGSLGGYGDGKGGDDNPAGPVVASVGAGGTIATAGLHAHGIVAQSIGGGGGIVSGAWPFSAGVHLGGSSGLRGFGGAVTVTNAGAISTQGGSALGVVAQSIGGGGGFWIGSASYFSSAEIGGSRDDDAGGAAGNVTVTLGGSGSIATSGNGSWGVLAQSIGGGGGFMGDSTQSNWQGAFASQSGLGNQGGILANRSNGGGGSVTVSVPAGTSITTTGSNAHGIVAQSIGGSGGIVSLQTSSLVGSNADYVKNGDQISSYDGHGGTVQVSVGGTVAATGSGAYGVFAQSSGTDSGKNGLVTVDIAGAVYGNAAGVAAANLLGSGSTVTVASGATLAGGCTGAGTANCTSAGYALLAMTKESAGLVLANNGGTVVGSVSGGVKAENAAAGAAAAPTPGLSFINSGTFRAGRELTNVAMEDHGTTHVGAQPGLFAELVLTNSSYRYDRSARLVVDADFLNGRADAIRLVGSSWGALGAGGDPLAVVLNSAHLMPGARLAILTGDAASSVGAPTPFAVQSASPAFSYAVTPTSGPQGTTYWLESRADFTPDAVGLHRNERAVAGYLQRIWDGGTGTPAQRTLSDTFARLATVAADGYESTLAGLVGRLPVVQAAAAPLAAQSFLLNMAGCAGFQGTGVALVERPCVWNRVIGGESRVDSGEPDGYKRRFASWQGGGQMVLADDWYLGGGIAYSDDRFADLGPNESGSGHGLLAGIGLKRQAGPWVLSATIAGGNAWADGSRRFALPGVGASAPLSYTATASNRTSFVDGKLRATYAIAFDDAYLRPALDVDVLYTRMGGYRESGADLYSLDVAASSQTLFMATPAVEAGKRMTLDAGATLRVYGMLGLSVLSRDGFSASAALAGLPGAGSFDVTAPIPDVFGKAALGVEFFRAGGLEARLQYNADFGNGYFGQAATFRLGYNF